MLPMRYHALHFAAKNNKRKINRNTLLHASDYMTICLRKYAILAATDRATTHSTTWMSFGYSLYLKIYLSIKWIYHNTAHSFFHLSPSLFVYEWKQFYSIFNWGIMEWKLPVPLASTHSNCDENKSVVNEMFFIRMDYSNSINQSVYCFQIVIFRFFFLIFFFVNKLWYVWLTPI